VRLPHRVVVVGAGLLGGSVLAALQPRRGPKGKGVHLTAVSSPKTLDGLRDRDWCDELHEYAHLDEACDQADLVLLCAPLSVIHEQIDRIAGSRDRLAPGALVMDVGSTKSEICRHGFAAFPDEGADSPRFVGGHPMAGSEKSGLSASDPLLYQSALWVLCPPQDFPKERLESAKALVAAVGARVAILYPDLHDAAVARISHVPQVLASVLSGWAGSKERYAEASLALAAGGFRDMTRLALSSWEVWRDILATNPSPIAEGLQDLSERLAVLAVKAKSWAGDHASAAKETESDAEQRRRLAESEKAFREAFAAGKGFREKFKMPRKGIAHDLSEFVVRLEDSPGQLLALLKPLAQSQINVQDIEILKVREGESGTVLLGFATSEEALEARTILGNRFLVMDR
jgi:prephenate dehydrogenase